MNEDKDIPTKKIRCRCRGQDVPEFIDPCIRDLVECLNRHGIKTSASCCGHGLGPGRVLISSDSLKDNGAGVFELRTSKKPILMPFDWGEQKWLEDKDYSGDHHDWFLRKPYTSKGDT